LTSSGKQQRNRFLAAFSLKVNAVATARNVVSHGGELLDGACITPKAVGPEKQHAKSDYRNPAKLVSYRDNAQTVRQPALSV
jgi:hypothetical protein